MSPVLTEIENFLSANGMAPSTFGLKAVGDGKFVTRLRAGKRCWPETAEKARTFIKLNKKRTRKTGGRTTAEQVVA